MLFRFITFNFAILLLHLLDCMLGHINTGSLLPERNSTNTLLGLYIMNC